MAPLSPPERGGSSRGIRSQALFALMMSLGLFQCDFGDAELLESIGGMCDRPRVDLVCGAGTKWFVSGVESETWKGCAPKACKMFPAISNGHTKPSFGRVEIGERIKVFCDPGYELDGAPDASATPTCQDDCVFEAHQRCKKKVCIVNYEVPNGIIADTRNELALGDFVTVRCDDGYMSSDAVPTFPDGCTSTFKRTCLPDGSFSNSDLRCVQVVCPRYPPSHESLRCAGECGLFSDSTVGRVSPASSSIALGESIAISCDPGYRWDTPSSNFLECSSNCLYQPSSSGLANGSCVPQTCALPERDPNAANWPRRLTSVLYRSSVEIECSEGYASSDLCLPLRAYGCHLLDSDSNPAFDQPVEACLHAVCSASTFPENVTPLNNSLYNYSSLITAQCKAGHRAVEIANQSVTDMPETANCLGNFQTGVPLVCGSEEAPCSWQFGRVCLPVQCNLSSILPHSSSISPDRQVIRFAERVTVTCDVGFRLSNASGGVGRREDEYQTTLTCQDDCEVDSDPLFCVPTACGDFATGPTQMLVAGTADAMLHGDSILLSCVGGLIPVGSLTSSCESTFEVRLCPLPFYATTMPGTDLNSNSATGPIFLLLLLLGVVRRWTFRREHHVRASVVRERLRAAMRVRGRPQRSDERLGGRLHDRARYRAERVLPHRVPRSRERARAVR
eukprot:2159409-Rhodomonas_salina.2